MGLDRKWKFLTVRWWLVHCTGMAVVYAAGRLTAAAWGG